MKRTPVLLALLPFFAACGSDARVVVHATVDGRPVTDLPVRLLPYDRQAILDSISGALERPEPTVPAELLQQVRSLGAATGPGKPPGDTAAARAAAQNAQALRARVDSIARARQAWADTVFKLYEEVARTKQGELGRAEEGDTTDTAGRAVLGADEGKSWVVARYVLPQRELEWNVPVTLRGDSVVIRLTRENAKERPFAQ
ncbi:MAG TPA: hypothetical protein VHG91_14475 [Longimicrobium sp.]|nr:hypothetical protein [Longimicrobium sp.]